MNPTYKGDKLHPIDCTGDCVVGDSVAFERAVFTGSFRSAKFSHFEMVRGDIVKESYGAAKQQHTFTLELEGGRKTLIKGRNLYKNGVWRTPWVDESQRHQVTAEKHSRGSVARAARHERISETQPWRI